MNPIVLKLSKVWQHASSLSKGSELITPRDEASFRQVLYLETSNEEEYSSSDNFLVFDKIGYITNGCIDNIRQMQDINLQIFAMYRRLKLINNDINRIEVYSNEIKKFLLSKQLQ